MSRKHLPARQGWARLAVLAAVVCLAGGDRSGAAPPAAASSPAATAGGSLAPGGIVEGIPVLSPADLKKRTGIDNTSPSTWRMVVRGAWLEPYLFKADWADVGSFGMSRATTHRLFVGPYEEYPFYYAGEWCHNVFGGYVDLNYEPWGPGAEHIIETKTSVGGVLLVSDPEFPIHLKFTPQGAAYISGRGTARYRSGKTVALGDTMTPADWRKLASSGTGLAREGAITALGYLKDKEGVAILAPLASDPETVVRIKAAAALGRIGGKEAVAALAKMLQDADEQVRGVAAEAIGLAGTDDTAAIAGLISLVGKAEDVNSPREAEVGLWALQQLAAMNKALSENTDLKPLAVDPKSMDALRGWAKDTAKKNRRGLAMRACGLAADKEVDALLASTVGDKTCNGREELLALYALRMKKAAFPALQRLIADKAEPSFTRRVAAWMAGRVGKEEAVALLAPYLKQDADPLLRVGAILGLGQSGAPAAAKHLREFYDQSADEDLKAAIAEGLSMLGPAAGPQLKSLAGAKEPLVRYNAIVGLARTKTKDYADVLAAALADEQQAIRSAAAEGLDALKWEAQTPRDKLFYALAKGQSLKDPAVTLDEPTVAEMGSILANADFKGRCLAAEVLGRSRSKAAGAPLVKALSDGDMLVREKAARALEAMGWTPGTDEERARYLAAKMDFAACAKLKEKAAPALVQVLVADYGGGVEWLSDTLVEIGPASVPALVAQVGSKYDTHAKWICQSLVRLGDASCEPLAKALSDGNLREKTWAARALRNLGNPKAVAALRTALAAVPEPAAKSTPGPSLKPMTGSQWDRDERTPEGDARRAIQFAINALDKTRGGDKDK